MKYDVIIVGCGGAGLMTARELGRRGFRTLLIDRKQDVLSFSFNTLGSFMNISDFDLSKDVVAREINSIILYSRNFKRTVSCEGYVLDKRALHKELLESLDKTYVSILTGTAIQSYAIADSGALTSVTDQNGQTYQASYFVDATGLSGFFSKAFGLQERQTDLATGVEYNVRYKGKTNEAHLLIGKIYEGGYGWIFPLQNDRAIIGFGTYNKHVVKELKKRLDRIITLPQIARLVEKDTDKSEGGTIPVTPVLDRFVHHNLVCVGDSVSQVNPIVGEGYKFIFETAFLATAAIEKALLQKDPGLLMTYEDEWRQRFYKNYMFSKRIQEKVFRYSKSDLLVDLGVLYLKGKKEEKVLKVLAGEYHRG